MKTTTFKREHMTAQIIALLSSYPVYTVIEKDEIVIRVYVSERHLRAGTIVSAYIAGTLQSAQAMLSLHAFKSTIETRDEEQCLVLRGEVHFVHINLDYAVTSAIARIAQRRDAQMLVSYVTPEEQADVMMRENVPFMFRIQAQSLKVACITALAIKNDALAGESENADLDEDDQEDEM